VLTPHGSEAFSFMEKRRGTRDNQHQTKIRLGKDIVYTPSGVTEERMDVGGL
jgi:hypothetical protein